MSTSEALDVWRSFLERTPPNTSLKIPGLASAVVNRSSAINGVEVASGWFLETPQIQLHCEDDDGPRRFDATKEGFDGPIGFNATREGFGVPYSRNYLFMTYRCRDCQSTKKTFAVLVIRSNGADVEAMKLGEYPPFSVPISSRIQKLLSKSDLKLYRKGSRAEAQGLGIGAATYFRRIVEGQWKRLVTDIRNAVKRLGVDDLGVYDVALQETQFSKAVGMLKDAIPDKLLILDGENPLTLLYRPLSRQLHELNDEECLQQAADIRVVLTALLENIANVLKAQDELNEAATRLKARPPPTD